MNRFNLCLLALGLFTLSACTTTPFGLDRLSRVDPLNYYQWVLLAEDISLQEERIRFATMPISEKTAVGSIRHAILLSARHESDTPSELEALTIISSVDMDSLPADYQAFAVLWSDVLNARQLAKDSQELILTLEQEKALLQTQIDALTSIEQQLNSRESLQGL